MPLPSGSEVECCTIIETLGAGGFGITYKAWDSREEREIALKENFPSWLVRRDNNGQVCLTGNRKDFEWTMRHFIDEARILARLHHRNIVRVYRAFEGNGTAYFVMEYLNATGLNKKCGAALWTENDLRALMTQLLDALQYLHKQGICHRDIKPANIMLRHSDKSPVLIDFGAAKSGPSRNTYTCGFISMGYTSPEQLANPAALSPGIDIYSMGATLYCVLTGQPPLNASARLIKDELTPLHTRKDMLAHYSRALLYSIDKALAIKPEQRHPSAESWLHDIQHPSTPAKKEPAATETSSLRSVTPHPRPTPHSEANSVNWQKIFLWAFWIGGILLVIIGFTLVSAPTQRHELDNLFPLAIFLALVGLGGLLYYRTRQDG